MFKNVVFFKIKFGNDENVTAEQLAEAAESLRFAPCGPTTQSSAGFVPPRPSANVLVENIGGQLILKVQTEVKRVPASAIKRELEAACERIERETGRKPGPRAKKQLKEDIVLSLLPRAFSKVSAQPVWLDIQHGYLWMEGGSYGACDGALTLMVELLTSMKCEPVIERVHTLNSPAAAMSQWLMTDEAPAGFTVDDELELKQQDGCGAKVVYSKHSLALEEIKQHIREGKLPTKLALTYEDQLSFVLVADMSLKKLSFLGTDSADAASADAFDGEVALETLLLQKMLPELLDALGGLPAQEAQG